MIQKIKTIWENKWLILEGVIGYYFTKKKHKKIADYRMKICARCPLYDTVGTKCLVPGTQPCCGSCGCSLDYKLYSMSSECPEGHWKAIMSEEDEDKLNAYIDDTNI
mgnify:FL=1